MVFTAAISCYTIITSYIIYRELRTKLRLKKEISEERYKSETNSLIHLERVKFFTNISHDFKTPLSLIIAPIEKIEETNHQKEN